MAAYITIAEQSTEEFVSKTSGVMTIQDIMSASVSATSIAHTRVSTLAPILLPNTTILVQNVIMKWIFIAVGALGLFNNLVVMVIVLKVKKLRQQPRNWFIFYQSAADFINAILIVAIANRTALTYLDGVLGSMVCVLWLSNALYHATTLASAYILAAFTIEVYMAIVHPVRHKNVFSHKLVTFMVVIAWIIGFCYPIGTYIGIARVVNGVCYTSYAWMPVAIPMTIVNFLFKMAIPLILYASFYAMTFVSLRRRVRVTRPTTSTTIATAISTSRSGDKKATSNSHYSKASHNVAMTVMYSLIFHVLSWTGNQVLIIMGTFGNPVDPSSLLYQIFILAIYSNSCVNPVVYAIKYRQFRSALLRILRLNSFSQKPPTKGNRVSGVEGGATDGT